MNDPIIVCPTCKTEIKLTESLAMPLIESTRKEYEKKIEKIQSEVSTREKEIEHERQELDKLKEGIEDQVLQRLSAERDRISKEEARKARLAVSSDLERRSGEITELQDLLKQSNDKLAVAQSAQAELIRKKRELDDAKREMDLTIEKRVQDSVETIRFQARKNADEEYKLKVMERDQTISSMQKQIEELKQKAEQGSQQLQGEVQELELEAILTARFPRDVIEPVPKGVHGGDILHSVIAASGQNCGLILWETKRTKNWADTWLAKLRDDQRAAKAELAVLVSKTVPKEIDGFDIREGVCVVQPRYAIPLAVLLRQSLTDVASARRAREGQQTKMELLYDYLTGPHFRQRVQAIVEKFGEMQEDLDRERRVMTKQWAKRQEQIHGVVEATAGMYGDLQGIAGKSLHEVAGLDLKALGPGTTSTQDDQQPKHMKKKD
jgi:hypothetical protein